MRIIIQLEVYMENKIHEKYGDKEKIYVVLFYYHFY